MTIRNYYNYIPTMCEEIDLYKDVIDYIRDNDINLMFLTPQEANIDREKFYNTIVKFCISRNFSPDRIFYLNHKESNLYPPQDCTHP